MIKFEQTTDTDFIRECITAPHVWRVGSDDGMISIDPKLLFIKLDGKIWVKAGEYGLFVGEARNSVTYEVHTFLFPNARGKAVEIAKAAMQWLFSNTHCLRITTTVPDYNKLAIRLSLKSGMEFMGINKKSFMKDGVLYDQQLFGISKEDLCL